MDASRLWLRQFISFQLVIFMLIKVCYVLFHILGYGAWFEVLMLRAFSLSSNGFEFLRYPWTFITHLFLHFSFWHLVFNMFALWFVGKFFLNYFTVEQFVGVYILGGVLGAICYLAGGWQMDLKYLVGASASIIALLFAVIFSKPKLSFNLFLWPIRLIYLAICLVAFYGIGLLSMRSFGSSLSHLGGVFGGGLAAVLWHMHYKVVDYLGIYLIRGWQFLFNRKSKPKAFAFKNAGSSSSDYAYNQAEHAEMEQVNEVLDKVSRSGYESLSKAEKLLLFKMGNREHGKK